MPTITIDVPENVPIERIKRKIQKLITEERLKWELFEKAKEELNLTEEDLKDFEKAREEAWKGIKKKYGL